MNIPQISKPALYLFLLLSLLLPLPAYPLTNHPYTITEEQQAFGDMIQNFINEMDLKYGMTCTGDGSSKQEKVTSISLMLSAYRRASLEEAREIHIQAKERLVEMIQENPKIQSYLSVTPFPKEDIRLSIIYGPDSTFYYCDGTVAGTIEGQGQLYYLSSGVLKLRLIDLHEEPYEEALKMVLSHLFCKFRLGHFGQIKKTGMKKGRIAVFPSIPWQRCPFYLAQNEESYAPKKNNEGRNSPTFAVAPSMKAQAIEKYQKRGG